MADEIVTVNDLVTTHAAKLKETTEVASTEIKEPVVPKGEEKTPPPPGQDDTPPADPLKDLLSEFNLESLDALKERLKPPTADKPESPEEKEKRENLYRVDMQKYAVENGLMKPDEFARLEALKGKEDRSLVYESWLASWKEENPDVEPEDVEEQAKRDFESEYRLDSTNEKTKARGLAKIQKEAKEMRDPLENAYGKLKVEFDEDRTVKADYPDFNKKVTGFIQENIPAKIKLFETKDGDESVPVEIELTEQQRKDVYKKVAAKMLTSDTYKLYKKGDLTKVQELVKKEAEDTIWNDQRDAGLTKIAETFLKRGDDKGYKRGSVGARQPFPIVKDEKGPGGLDRVSESQKVIDSLNGKK